jgi:hypothetical protein
MMLLERENNLIRPTWRQCWKLHEQENLTEKEEAKKQTVRTAIKLTTIRRVFLQRKLQETREALVRLVAPPPAWIRWVVSLPKYDSGTGGWQKGIICAMVTESSSGKHNET